MPVPVPAFPSTLDRPADTEGPASLTIRPWPDTVIDALGHDPRSVYVERFWLGILGPSSVFLLRRLASELEAQPAGFELPLRDTARALGLGMRGGRSSPFLRTLHRCCQFGMAQPADASSLLVRRKLPPLTRQQVQRLPDPVQVAHAEWQAGALHTSDVEQLRTRARRLALSLLELGEDIEGAERQLHRWKFHPALAREATAWAWDRHRRAFDGPPDGPSAA